MRSRTNEEIIAILPYRGGDDLLKSTYVRHGLIGIVVFLTILLLVSVSITLASTVRIVSGGRELPDRFSPIYTANGFIVPVEVATLFGGAVEREGDAWIVRKGGQSAIFRQGVAVAVVGERQSQLPRAPIQLDDQLYVPLRFLGDFLGLKISVSGNTLDITTWSSLTPSRGRASQLVDAFSSFAEVQPSAVATDGGVNASLAAPTLYEGTIPLQTSPSTFGQVGAAVVEGGTSPFETSEPTRAEAVSSLLSSGRGAGSVVGGEPPLLEERLTTVSEAIARLLGNLGIKPEQQLAWFALQRATGLSLRVDSDNGSWAYHLSGPTQGATTAHLIDPPRILVDLPGVAGANLDPYVPLDPVVDRIRAVDHDGSLRLIFDLAEGVGHRLVHEGDEATLVVFRPLRNVEVDADLHGGRIRLDVSGNTPYKISRLTQPERVVLDLFDTTLVEAPFAIGPLEGPVTQVRAAQFQPDVARIVLDVASETPVEVASTQGAFTLSYGDQLGFVAYRIPSAREFHVGVAAPHDASIVIHRLFQPDRLVMDVSGARLAAPLRDALFLEGPVSRLRASQYDETTVRVVADLRYHVRYTLKEEGERRVLVMEQPLLTGRTLTVDAGHGGHDGGAVGVRQGALEKEINLDIARRLQKLLEGAEATVHMTRVDDTFVDLWARADLANETESDVLVSIHANSAPNNSHAKGTETYVRMGEPLSERLGASIQRSLTSALSTVDRGVRPNRYLVVRRAAMPAALVEVAFLANPEEEALLMEAWYRERAAEGIFNGLLRYFYPEDELESESSGENSIGSPWSRLLEAVASGVATASS